MGRPACELDCAPEHLAKENGPPAYYKSGQDVIQSDYSDNCVYCSLINKKNDSIPPSHANDCAQVDELPLTSYAPLSHSPFDNSAVGNGHKFNNLTIHIACGTVFVVITCAIAYHIWTIMIVLTPTKLIADELWKPVFTPTLNAHRSKLHSPVFLVETSHGISSHTSMPLVEKNETILGLEICGYMQPEELFHTFGIAKNADALILNNSLNGMCDIQQINNPARKRPSADLPKLRTLTLDGFAPCPGMFSVLADNLRMRNLNHLRLHNTVINSVNFLKFQNFLQKQRNSIKALTLQNTVISAGMLIVPSLGMLGRLKQVCIESVGNALETEHTFALGNAFCDLAPELEQFHMWSGRLAYRDFSRLLSCGKLKELFVSVQLPEDIVAIDALEMVRGLPRLEHIRITFYRNSCHNSTHEFALKVTGLAKVRQRVQALVVLSNCPVFEDGPGVQHPKRAVGQFRELIPNQYDPKCF